MSKTLTQGQLVDGVSYEAKIEDGVLKIQAQADLSKLVDVAADKIEAPQAIEAVVVQLLKSAVKSI